MDIRLNEGQQLIRQTVRELARARIAPRARDIDATGEFPWDVVELFRRHDIFALPFPPKYGGLSGSALTLNVAIEETAKACASSALILMINELGTLPIQLFGSDELKQRFLPKCATGEWSPAFALSEPEAGSDPASMRTTAGRAGEEGVVNGAQDWRATAGVAGMLYGSGNHALIPICCRCARAAVVAPKAACWRKRPALRLGVP